jgi:hypothetical protein
MAIIKQDDTPQKKIAKVFLEQHGFTNVVIRKEPSDIVCTCPQDITITIDGKQTHFKANEEYVFDVKGGNVGKGDKRRGIDKEYWGALTHTELKAALEKGLFFKWICVFRNDSDASQVDKLSGWTFRIYDTDDLMQYVYVPPLVFHMIIPPIIKNPNARKNKNKQTKPVKSIQKIDLKKLKYAIETYDKLKEDCDKM